MNLTEHEIDISVNKGTGSLLTHFEEAICNHIPANKIPVRFVVTQSDSAGYHCELDLLDKSDDIQFQQPSNIFDFMQRKIENKNEFNAVLIIPTGIGAEIGGHSGDATPVARLMASLCNTLITHPNVVNASDLNELPENGLYVEGSVISRLLMGTVGLQKVNSNRVLLIIDEHKDSRMVDFTINAVSAARAVLGMDCPLVIKMDPPINMHAQYSSSGRAVGRIEGVERLCNLLLKHRIKYDAIGIASVIDVPDWFHQEYFQTHSDMVNPWGGVEAMLTHAISMLFNLPSAHAPMMESMEILNLEIGITDPRKAAEAVSTAFLHSVLKGLYRSPQIITDKLLFQYPNVLTVADISCLVIPDGCLGLPILGALEQGIPIIAVRENRNRMKNNLEKLPFASNKLFIVENYLEAAGVMAALKNGVSVSSVRRPFAETKIICEKTIHEKEQLKEFKHSEAFTSVIKSKT